MAARSEVLREHVHCRCLSRSLHRPGLHHETRCNGRREGARLKCNARHEFKILECSAMPYPVSSSAKIDLLAFAGRCFGLHLRCRSLEVRTHWEFVGVAVPGPLIPEEHTAEATLEASRPPAQRPSTRAAVWLCAGCNGVPAKRSSLSRRSPKSSCTATLFNSATCLLPKTGRVPNPLQRHQRA